MKLASVLTPLSEENLALAAQTGVECVTIRYQGPVLDDWKPAVELIRSYGMDIAAVEDAIAMENIIRGTQGREEEIEGIISLLRIMKQLENSKMKKKLTTTGAKSVMALSPETEAARAQAAQDAKLARKTSIRRLSTASMLFQKKLDTVSKKIDDSLKLGDE